MANKLYAKLSATHLLLLVSLLAASGWAFSKQSMTALTPLYFMAIRFIGGAFVVALLDLKAFTLLDRRDWLKAILLGAVLGLQTAIWSIALYTSPNMGLGGFLVSLGVIAAPALKQFVFRQSSSFIVYPLLFGALGLTTLLTAGEHAFALADGIFLLSALAFAFYIVLSEIFAKKIPAVPLTCIQLQMAAVVCLAGAFTFEPFPTAAIFDVIGWILLSILIATGLRFFLMVKAHSLPTKNNQSLVLILEPVWVMMIAMIFYGELLNTQQAIGCFLILIALLINSKHKK